MYIKSLHLENLKGFSDVSFDFERPDGSFAGWTVFVGGNSSGKSTILKGISLAIMGPEAGGRLMGSTIGWIQKDQSKASVTVTIKWDRYVDKFKSSGAPPAETFQAGVRWLLEEKDDDVPQFRALYHQYPNGSKKQIPDRGPWSPNANGWFAAAYGPMRRLTGSSSEAMRFSVSREIDSRFATLFREDAALSESEEWLRRMHARSLEAKTPEIQKVLDGVQALLGDGLLPHGMKISRITVDHVFVIDGKGMELPMRDISDGCRSIYATVLDLVHGLYEVNGLDDLFSIDSTGGPIVNQPGVVIVDEIEAHLHPAWQRDIPQWLKTHFPKIQFLVTSHSPLIAQSADENGLFILPLQDDYSTLPRPATDVEYQKVRWGTAHKTVLGVAFGLSNTRTEWARQQIVKWQDLNAKEKAGATLTSTERKDLNGLRKQLEVAFDGGTKIDIS